MSRVVKRFAIIGAAGYVAPKHMQAIKDLGHQLIAALDPSDSVGVLDSYFPDAFFFTEMERFDRFLEKEKYKGQPLDYLVVCSPNYLHDAHVRFGLKHNADVICEKPLVLNHWNINPLIDLEAKSGRKVYNILQLRLHPEVKRLINYIDSLPKNNPLDVELTYITPRGNWYYSSWKGDESKSGGLMTNIGIHLFDLLSWIWGDAKEVKLHQNTFDRAAGSLKFENVHVKWFLSISKNLEFEGPSRTIKIDSQIFDFTKGFENLHTLSYKKILCNTGFGISEVVKSIKLLNRIQKSKIDENPNYSHYLLDLPLGNHPFS